MAAADALAIGVGAVLGKKLPERTVRIGAAVLFVLFGVLLLVEALAPLGAGRVPTRTAMPTRAGSAANIARAPCAASSTGRAADS